ncbi:MAG: helix-turn-helix transcriptional regulator [Salinivirgaceae bacterium]|jgi:transcriptional regulator with XRE-family HTH domain|nr:helix-turn-helix transcriptional regulator [Salinivirgaceae bacterium]
MEIKNRLARIISSEGLTSAAFADSIGVQRSSISHIISGRNKPSLDFLQKTLISYPKYNSEWLITGVGDIYKVPIQTNIYDAIENEPSGDSALNTAQNKHNELNNVAGELKDVIKAAEIQEEDPPKYKDNFTDPPPLNNELPAKKVSKIVIFYSDKTFSEYKPNNTDEV